MSRIGQPTVFAQFPTKTFTGNGSQYQWTLDYAPGTKGAIDVLIGNTPQHSSQFDLDNLTLTTGVVPNGVEVEVRYKGVMSLVQVPVDASVTMSKLSQDVQTLLGGASFKNLLIGGDFNTNPWQRGTSFTPVAATLTYVADRWCTYRATANYSVQKNNPSSPPSGVVSSLFLQRTSGDTGVSTINLGQSIETVNCKSLAGQKVTLSFWGVAGANMSAPLSVNVQSGTGADQNALSGFTGAATVVSQSQALTTSWVKYTFTGTVPANSTQLSVFFSYTPTGTAGANDWYQIANVQLEAGSTATTFENLPADVVLNRCYRYFEAGSVFAVAYGSSGGSVQRTMAHFKAIKRVSPTCTVSIVAGSLTSPGITNQNTSGIWVGFSSSGPGVEGQFGWTASAEL